MQALRGPYVDVHGERRAFEFHICTYVERYRVQLKRLVVVVEERHRAGPQRALFFLAGQPRIEMLDGFSLIRVSASVRVKPECHTAGG